MARCKVTGLNELADMFEKQLKDTEDIVNEILFECGNILRDEMKSTVRSSADRGYATGNLENSIIPTKPIKNGSGHFVAVRPVGTDSKGVRNGEKLQYLEHGTKKGQVARSDLSQVGDKAELKCADKAQEIFDKHVKL